MIQFSFKFNDTFTISLEVNSTTRLHQKEISSTSRNGLQQSLREAILGGSGGSSNGDGNNSHRDMVRIGTIRYTFLIGISNQTKLNKYKIGELLLV